MNRSDISLCIQHMSQATGTDSTVCLPQRSCFPFYFAVMTYFPPKQLIGTTLCDRFITSILSSEKQFIPFHTKPLLILALNEDTFSAIHMPQPLSPLNTEKTHVNLCLAEPTEIYASTQRLFKVTVPVDGLFSIETHPNLRNTRPCRLANSICQIETNKSFHIWVPNMSNSKKSLPKHTRVGLLTSAPSVVFHQTTASEDDDA